MKHKQAYKNRDGVKHYNTTNRGPVETLCSLAVGAVIFLLLTGAALSVYKITTETLENIQTAQTEREADLEDLEAIAAELENIEN